MTLAHGTDRLETERLILRRFTRDDLPFIMRTHLIPEVTRYLGHGGTRSAEESLAWMELTLRTYRELALGQLAVLRKSDGVIVGRCGLSDLSIETPHPRGSTPRAWFDRAQVPAGTRLIQEQELGYTFDPAHWGQGYASEAARGVAKYARATLHPPCMISVIHPENTRSLRVAEKFGLRLDGRVQLQEHEFDRYVWPTTIS